MASVAPKAQRPIRPTEISPTLSLKPPFNSFASPDPAIRMIQFLHPGYPDNENILLILPAFDSGGLHHETARTACAILANCRWDGYLTTARDGPPVEIGLDAILLHSRYYFNVDDDSDYPVVPSFDHFRLLSLPKSWADNECAPIQPNTKDKVPDRDQTCRITCSSLPNEIAHIIPAAQEEWWRANSMFLHTSRPKKSFETNCPDNAIFLRRDLHLLWDTHKFAIVPKCGRWVVHVLDNLTTDELQTRYHNLELQPLLGVVREFLLVRFALAILVDNNLFVRQGTRRKLVVLEDNKPQTKILSGKDCRLQFGPSSRSRSQSPKKRQKSAQGEEDEEQYSDGGSFLGDWEAEQWGLPRKRGLDSSSYASDQDMSGEERGRQRKRRRSTHDWDAMTPSTTSPDPGLITSSGQTSFDSNRGSGKVITSGKREQTPLLNISLGTVNRDSGESRLVKDV